MIAELLTEHIALKKRLGRKNKSTMGICVLDGYSRFIVHWDLRENMKENDVAIVQQTAL